MVYGALGRAKAYPGVRLVCIAVSIAAQLSCSNPQVLTSNSGPSEPRAAKLVPVKSSRSARPEERAPISQPPEPQLPPQTTVNWEDELAIATEHAQARRCHEALIHFRAVINAQPHNLAALEGITACAGYVGNHEESIETAELLVHLDPSRKSKLDSWIEIQRLSMAVRSARAQNDAGSATEAVATMRAISGQVRRCPQYLWWLGYFEAAANDLHAPSTLKQALSARCDGESLDADTVAMVYESLAAIAAQAGLWAKAESYIRAGLGLSNVDPRVRAGLEYKLMILKEHNLPAR